MVSNNQDGVDVNPQFLWNAGATFVYSTKTHLGFGIDLKYSSEGYDASSVFGDSIIDFSIHLNYLRLPVKMIYFFGKYGDHFRPKIFLGVNPGFLLSAKEETDPAEDIDVKESFNSFDLGVQG